MHTMIPDAQFGTQPDIVDGEWLEADGLGGFASGTVKGLRTRRYHALLLAATNPPTGRMVLVNGVEAWVETRAGRYPLSAQHYAPDVIFPDSRPFLAGFQSEPWPRWTFQLDAGMLIELELFAPHNTAAVALRWRLLGSGGTNSGHHETGSAEAVRLTVRPLMSGRDYHALHHENSAFQFQPEARDGILCWHPYSGVPGIVVKTQGEYRHEPTWYRNFLYQAERERGLDDCEDLASPGSFHWNLAEADAEILFAVEGLAGVEDLLLSGRDYASIRLREEQRRRALGTLRSADAYVVRRGAGRTLVAGYPWFTDWGRDTFIAIRGQCIATHRLQEASEILREWSQHVSAGMLPNRFPDHGGIAEYNSVDASLWFIIAVHDFLKASDDGRNSVSQEVAEQLWQACEAIVAGYSRGTRFGIRRDEDCLLAAGEPNSSLTWMDARFDNRAVTPRVGKPVEVQALWLNALWILGQRNPAWLAEFQRGQVSFRQRFWNAERHSLYDVVDVDHTAGKHDAALRANQILAVGGLPLCLLEPDQARSVVEVVEAHLWTPMGLKTLAAQEPGFVPYYRGGVAERDTAYHQGTVWPWLAGPFIEAWIRVRNSSAAAKQEARERFLAPLRKFQQGAGRGHLPEIADAEPPHFPRGCPFQAWSLGEFLRLERSVLT